MRALTILQPWADAITYSTKRVENRVWNTHYTGLLLIHAGARYAENVISGSDGPGVRSAILAVADLTGCHVADGDCCGAWGQRNVYHWTLDNVRALPEPVPAKGRLGLWRPGEELVAAVLGQLDDVPASR
jgi:hypothetical protein